MPYRAYINYGQLIKQSCFGDFNGMLNAVALCLVEFFILGHRELFVIRFILRAAYIICNKVPLIS
jgi:hypothetical protein